MGSGQWAVGSGQRAEAAANPKNKKPRAPQHVWDL